MAAISELRGVLGCRPKLRGDTEHVWVSVRCEDGGIRIAVQDGNAALTVDEARRLAEQILELAYTLEASNA